MVGLGVMGRNLVLNMADHGYAVAGYDKDAAKVEASAAGSNRTQGPRRGGYQGVSLRCSARPRAIMMLVPAGAPVDSVIKDLLPLLDRGDLIIDAGNSYFKDTDCARPQPDSERHPISWRGRVGWRRRRASRTEHHARRAERGLRARPSRF